MRLNRPTVKTVVFLCATTRRGGMAKHGVAIPPTCGFGRIDRPTDFLYIVGRSVGRILRGGWMTQNEREKLRQRIKQINPWNSTADDISRAIDVIEARILITGDRK